MRTPSLAFFCLLSALPAQATKAPPQLAFPETHAGRAAQAYFAAVADGTEAACVAFEAAWRAPEKLETSSAAERGSRLVELLDRIGVLQPVRLAAADAASVAVVARSDQIPMALQCTFEMQPQAPHKLLSIAIRPAMTEAEEVEDDWETLPELLGRVREQCGAPALAAEMVRDGEVASIGAVGAAATGTDTAVQADDRFHLGSISKSMTATMIGRLVERDVLSWTTTIGEALRELDVREDYRAVTLRQLLQHRGGIQPHLLFSDEESARWSAPPTPLAQRAAFVAAVLQEEPNGTPGATFDYSNAGYAIAAHIAERTTGKTWETLMRDEVFGPLELETAEFGWPASPARPTQPQGHTVEGESLTPEGLEAEPVGGFLAPAGDVCMSMGDLGRFARAHLRGLAGEDGLLTAATVRTLHTAPKATGGMVYACGWMLEERDGLIAHVHAGSGGTFYVSMELYPEHDVAIVVAANAATAEVLGGIEAVLTALRTRHDIGE
ncbi:MAG: serine hydrolase domain-containing protein [Planctomycetota bacterium]